METMRVAVIDDQQAIIDFVRAILEEEGYTVVAWRTEAGAQAFLRETAPALLVLDLHLEERDAGIRILEALRAEAETAGIAVILSTAQPRLTQGQHARLQMLGCGWLAKPYRFGTLLSAVQRGLSGAVGALPVAEE